MNREPHPDLFDTARMFRRSGTSSFAAAAAAEQAKVLNTHHRIWLALGERPRTADQVAVDFKMERNTIRARISELYKTGWVNSTDETRPTASGKPAVVWMAVEKCESFPVSGASFQAKTKRTPKTPDPAERDPMKELTHAA